MVLIYYIFYTCFVFLGYFFNLDASNVCRHLQKMGPLRAKSIGIKKDRALSQEDLSEIIMDGTEIQTQRPKKNQKIDYSGKKKKHTQKIEIRIQADGKIMNISKVYAGKTHDFKI